MEQQTLNYKFSDFEGPLDLLLTLISKNKINICDIKITELVDQYTEQIAIMQNNDMDIASEFLEMASRLVYIKSVILLPKYEEEAEELKRELTGQLIEYMECKRIAQVLPTMVSFDGFVREPSQIEYDLTYNRIHPKEDIAAAMENAAGRGKKRLPPAQEAFSGIVSKKIISVTSQIVRVIRSLWNRTEIRFNSLFLQAGGRSEMVATFLAVLELVKGNRVRIDGDGEEASLRLIKKSDSKSNNKVLEEL